MAERPLLEISGLTRSFRQGRQSYAALTGIDLTVAKGEILGLAGASGSGKTTLARLVLRLIEPDAGSIHFAGENWTRLRGGRLRAARGRMQMVFQDPLAAFNPRATVARLLDDPLRVHDLAPSGERGRAAGKLLERVGLPAELLARRPHELSGGQRQRVAIARALATRPDLIVFDEPVSALDVAVRAEILNLILDIREETGVACLFIAHDLAVMRVLCDRIAVLDQGRLVEVGETESLLAAPQSEATRRLIAAVPRLKVFSEAEL
jgi:peptide/nickel transport system ATP-binding protein